jgi:hypothetical protein
MGSYYNRPWRGYVEFQGPHSGEWRRAIKWPFGSVEAALAFGNRVIRDRLAWRVVDEGGNVYETIGVPVAFPVPFTEQEVA